MFTPGSIKFGEQPIAMRKTILINVLVFIVLLLGLELMSFLILNDEGNEKPFLLNYVSLKSNTPLHPLLGWSHNIGAFPDQINQYSLGFTYFRTDSVGSRKPIRIAVVGGSTSDNNYQNEAWPRFLAQELRQNGYSAEIYNGAVRGYSSSQELLKVVSEVVVLKPDIIISYSGVNERIVGDQQQHPYITEFETKLYDMFAGKPSSTFFPNLVACMGRLRKKMGLEKGKVDLGIVNENSFAQQWINNMKMMKGISDQLGIKFVAFLQPTLGIGRYTISEEEREYMVQGYPDFPLFYDEAIPLSKECDFIVDFTDVFEFEKNLYWDECHVTLEGNRIVSKHIYNELLNRGFILKTGN